jgi:hypothetical protein
MKIKVLVSYQAKKERRGLVKTVTKKIFLGPLLSTTFTARGSKKESDKDEPESILTSLGDNFMQIFYCVLLTM